MVQKRANFSLNVKKFYGNKTILITGTGYISESIVTALSDVDCTIRRVQRKKLNKPQNFERKCKIQEIQVDGYQELQWESLLYGVDVIFLLAAQTSALFADESPERDYRENLIPILRLLDAAQRSNLNSRIILASTASIFGSTGHNPVTEDRLDVPMGIYEIHKLTAENYLASYKQKGLIGTALRLSNVYGPGPISNERVGRGVLNTMIRSAVSGADISVYGDGNYFRDYIYIEDVVWAFLTAACFAHVLDQRKYLIGSGTRLTISEMASKVADLVSKNIGGPIKVNHIPFVNPPTNLETRSFVADASLFSSITGWTARVDVEDGIQRTINHFIDQSKLS